LVRIHADIAALPPNLCLSTTSAVYQLATADSSAPETLAAPHVRSLIHRDFLAPRAAVHPLLLTTTDVRTPKARQIAQNARVELAWWIDATQEQYRVSGKAYVLPAPNVGRSAAKGAAEGTVGEGEAVGMEVTALKLGSEFPGALLGGEGYDWEGKRREVFDAMSGHMKASWVRPVPGTPLPGGYAAAKKWTETLPKLSEVTEGKGGEDERKGVEEALRNFALVVIEPLEVDYVQLGVVPNQRTNFTKQGEKWIEAIVVP